MIDISQLPFSFMTFRFIHITTPQLLRLYATSLGGDMLYYQQHFFEDDTYFIALENDHHLVYAMLFIQHDIIQFISTGHKGMKPFVKKILDVFVHQFALSYATDTKGGDTP